MPNEKEIELDLDMDVVERLKIEIEAADEYLGKPIGKYLLEKFDNDPVLKQAYFDKGVTLENIVDYVNECARKYLNAQNGAVSDAVVFGWVVHFIQDGDKSKPDSVKTIIKNNNYELTDEEKEEARQKAIKRFEDEKLAKIKKAEEKKAEKQKREIEKEKAKEEEIGQMSLFDFGLEYETRD